MKRLAWILAIALAPVANAGELVLQQGVDGYAGTSDTTLVGSPENRKEQNFGGADSLRVGGVPHGGLKRLVLVRFDEIKDRLPAGAKVKAAYLELFKTGEPVDSGQYEKVPQGNRVIALYPLLKPWKPGEGKGEPQPQGATFSHRGGDADGVVEYWGDANQIEEGPVKRLDYSEVETARTPLRPNETGYWSRWDITLPVQQWIREPSSNHGVLLLAQSYYVGSDFTSSEGENVENRPRLIIEY